MSSTRLHISLLLIILATLFASCGNHGKGEVLASVYGHKLYESDIQALISDDMDSADSVTVVNAYIEQWMAKMAIVAKAESDLDDDELDKQVENYRNTMLVDAYERKMVANLIDSNVTDDEIVAYYNTHPDDFILHHSIVKATFIRMPQNSEAINKIRQLITLPTITDQNVTEMQSIAATDAEDYFFGESMWLPFVQLQSLVPLNITDEAGFLRTHTFYELSDNGTTYFIRFFDKHVAGEMSPLELEYDNIHNLILNKRGSVILTELRQNLLKEGLSDGKIVKFEI